MDPPLCGVFGGLRQKQISAEGQSHTIVVDGILHNVMKGRNES